MAELMTELRKKNINVEKLYKLITPENVKYIDIETYTPLMFALKKYGKTSDCDANVFLKILKYDCNLTKVDDNSYTALMYAFGWYGSNPNCDASVLLKMLDNDCNVLWTTYDGDNACRYAFDVYAQNPNCDSRVLLKLLNAEYYPECTQYTMDPPDTYLKHYIKNPYFNYDVFEQLYIRSYPEVRKIYLKTYLELRNKYVINPLRNWRGHARLTLMIERTNYLKRKILN